MKSKALVLMSSLVAFVMQRRQDRMASLAGSIMLAGLIIPCFGVNDIANEDVLRLLSQRVGLFLQDGYRRGHGVKFKLRPKVVCHRDLFGLSGKVKGSFQR